MNQVLAREYAAWLNEEKDAFGVADQALADEYAAWVSEDVGDSEGASEAMASVNAVLVAEETDANDADDAEEAEQITIELADERDQALESEIHQDEHPAESTEPAEDVGAETIKREMLKTAIGRIESAARTQRDFENVVVCWDKLNKTPCAGRRIMSCRAAMFPWSMGSPWTVLSSRNPTRCLAGGRSFADTSSK